LKGADLTYRCVCSGQIELTLTIYRDCNGLNLPSIQTINWRGGSACSGSVTAIRSSSTDISQTCSVGQSSCNGGTGSSGTEKHVYTATLSIPPNCSNLVFSWQTCCRNNAIISLASPNTESMYVEANYFAHAPNTCNSSPIFLNNPKLSTCIGNQVFYNHGAVDYDGDSLTFALTPCLNNDSTAVNYAQAYSGIQPTDPIHPIIIDPSTGAITFVPTSLITTPICVLVEEYRNGILIGSIVRDIEFEVLPCINISPVLSGINNQGVDSIDFVTTAYLGAELCFDIIGSTANPGSILSMSYDYSLDNSSFVVSSLPVSNQIVGTFCWTPSLDDVGFNFFTVTIYDDACPTKGTNQFSYVINVQPNSHPVDGGSDVSICLGDSTLLSAMSTATNISSYSWWPAIGLSNSNISNPKASPLSTTTYTVTLNYADGSQSTDHVTVVVEEGPQVWCSPNNINVCPEAPLTLTAVSDKPGMVFSWWHLSGGPCPSLLLGGISGTVVDRTSQLGIVMCNDPGLYTFQVVVTDTTTGCSTTEFVYITIGALPATPTCRNIYASTTGNPLAAGTKFDPVTLEEALSRSACTNTIVKLATGTYVIDNSININSNLTLEGGFIENQAWTKTSEIGATRLHRSTLNAEGVLNINRRLTALTAYGSTNFRLQDLTISTADAIVPGTSTYGLYLNNASDYNITRVNDDVGQASNGTDGASGCNATGGGAGLDGQPGDIDAVDLDVLGGAGGNGGNSCGSGAFLLGGQPGRNVSHAGAPVGDGGIATNASAGIVDGGAGGGGGRGGPAGNGGAGGAGGMGGTPFIGCSGTPSGLGSTVPGGAGGLVNTFNTGVPGFANGTAGLSGTDGIDGVDGCVGAMGTPGQLSFGGYYEAGSQGLMGQSGAGGSGGGGGGGGGGQINGGAIDGTGHGGGAGGGGGSGGTGGSGGFGGGGSFGIYISNNGANGAIEHSHILAGTAGVGGVGGVGGLGAVGGTGGIGALGLTPANVEVQAGGDGGKGGDGGNGGAGGDGQGGVSINIYWDGIGTVPLAQDSAYALYNQQ